MVELDGSYGEGGGQILRTALSLSCLLGKPFRIYSIRKGRRKPGLANQHLAGVLAAARISGAEVTGARVGSTELVFRPGPVRSGVYDIDIGTAGATSLVLQALLPALILSGGGSRVIITGGTHVPFSPPFDYVSEVFAPALARLGLDARLRIDQYGFYPRGGGKLHADIRPAVAVRPLTLTERGALTGVTGVAAVGNLDMRIAERERDSAREVIAARLGVPAEIKTASVPAIGQGTYIFLRAEYERSEMGFSAIGERGKRAEAVGAEAADELIRCHDTGAAVDPHLADQLALYLAIADGESEITTSSVTQHLLTNLWTVAQFHEYRYEVEGELGEAGRVRVEGQGPRHR